MSTAKDISVIVPTYRPGDYIRECIASLAAQTLDPARFEVIMVLNGPREPHHAEISGMAASLAPALDFRLFYSDTPGVSRARNIGLDLAGGEYVCFVDDDDFLSPGYLASLLRDASGADMVLADALSFADRKPYVMSGDYGIHRNYTALSGRVSGIRLLEARKYLNVPFAKLLRRDAVGDVRFDERFRNGEDALFMYALSPSLRSVARCSGGAVYHRRFRAGSAMTTRRPASHWYGVAARLALEYTRLYMVRFPRIPFSLYARGMGANLKHLKLLLKS